MSTLLVWWANERTATPYECVSTEDVTAVFAALSFPRKEEYVQFRYAGGAIREPIETVYAVSVEDEKTE